jgi:hypothetical protein
VCGAPATRAAAAAAQLKAASSVSLQLARTLSRTSRGAELDEAHEEAHEEEEAPADAAIPLVPSHADDETHAAPAPSDAAAPNVAPSPRVLEGVARPPPLMMVGSSDLDVARPPPLMLVPSPAAVPSEMDDWAIDEVGMDVDSSLPPPLHTHGGVAATDEEGSVLTHDGVKSSDEERSALRTPPPPPERYYSYASLNEHMLNFSLVRTATSPGPTPRAPPPALVPPLVRTATSPGPKPSRALPPAHTVSLPCHQPTSCPSPSPRLDL